MYLQHHHCHHCSTSGLMNHNLSRDLRGGNMKKQDVIPTYCLVTKADGLPNEVKHALNSASNTLRKLALLSRAH